MTALTDKDARTDILNRLRRAEGQIRGVQRMIEEGESCLKIGQQFSAVRKALDSAYVRMTVCFMQQELEARLGEQPEAGERIGGVLDVRTVATGPPGFNRNRGGPEVGTSS